MWGVLQAEVMDRHGLTASRWRGCGMASRWRRGKAARWLSGKASRWRGRAKGCHCERSAAIHAGMKSWTATSLRSSQWR